MTRYQVKPESHVHGMNASVIDTTIEADGGHVSWYPQVIATCWTVETAQTIAAILNSKLAPPPGEAQILGLATRSVRRIMAPGQKTVWQFNVHQLLGFARNIGAMYEERKP